MISGERLDREVDSAIKGMRRQFPFISATDAELRFAVLVGVGIAGEAELKEAQAKTHRAVMELGNALASLDHARRES